MSRNTIEKERCDLKIPKIENLRKGMILKNYIELCKILGIDVKTGNAKIYQLQDLERYFNFRKSGHKFVINEVYDEIKEKIYFNNGKYGESIQYAILKLLEGTENYEVCISAISFCNDLGLVNNNYAVGKRDIRLFAELMNLDIHVVYDFYYYSTSHLKNALETALHNLKNKKLLSYAKVLMLNKNDEIKKADLEEEQLIIDTEEEVLKEMNLDSELQAFRTKQEGVFYKTVNDRLKEKNDINYYFKAYDIFSFKDKIDLGLNTLDIKKQTLTELNKKVIFNLSDGVTRRNQKAIEEVKKTVAFGETNNPTLRLRTDKDYVSNNKELIKITIKFGKNINLKEKLKQKKSENIKDK